MKDDHTFPLTISLCLAKRRREEEWERVPSDFCVLCQARELGFAWISRWRYVKGFIRGLGINSVVVLPKESQLLKSIFARPACSLEPPQRRRARPLTCYYWRVNVLSYTFRKRSPLWWRIPGVTRCPMQRRRRRLPTCRMRSCKLLFFHETPTCILPARRFPSPNRSSAAINQYVNSFAIVLMAFLFGGQNKKPI